MFLKNMEELTSFRDRFLLNLTGQVGSSQFAYCSLRSWLGVRLPIEGSGVLANISLGDGLGRSAIITISVLLHHGGKEPVPLHTGHSSTPFPEHFTHLPSTH